MNTEGRGWFRNTGGRVVDAEQLGELNIRNVVVETRSGLREYLRERWWPEGLAEGRVNTGGEGR
jgi:hypothetical protein